ncbi:MAG: hypothetical protein A2942_00105 [Candidatus Lloydbacteria bacterium RIFCSPLOWO2_01_FULL_50_20]|uniref:Trigger factor n=1 Tax=Candidatus Lloydbacteria bacterium RIFCSPLOWO2_01_FULL_50_20 TaxID=1798665 RepID=A0A1G2DJC9_9BACT|nr:MAG: hypothetical protein A2942_00105 [Candidatus Lloydbacteria bacterium RIFCSPLOWO2_01_FULL_50_20]
MGEPETKKYAVKIKKLPLSQIEITALVPAEEFDAVRSEAVKHISANMELPGFRKGHVPENIIVAKLGNTAILEEMAEIAIGKAYPSIVIDNALDVLGRPQVRITKIAMGNPLEFTLATAVFPEFDLPDYKKLASKEAKVKDEVLITDEEVAKAIEQIAAVRLPAEDSAQAGAKNEADPSAKTVPQSLDDAYVKTLGDFSDVDDFQTKLRENMRKEKERSAKDKKRIAIIDAILVKTTIELPEIIVAQELTRMESEFENDVTRMGLTMENYLQAIKKTKEELQKDWKPDAKKRAKTQLIVSKIAEVEKLEPDSETLKREVGALRTRYPDAPEDRLENYLRMVLTNERVFQFLESDGTTPD